MTPVDGRAVFIEAPSGLDFVPACRIVEAMDRELYRTGPSDRPVWARAIVRGQVDGVARLRASLDQVHVIVDDVTPPHDGRVWSVEVLHREFSVDTIILGPEVTG